MASEDFEGMKQYRSAMERLREIAKIDWPNHWEAIQWAIAEIERLRTAVIEEREACILAARDAIYKLDSPMLNTLAYDAVGAAIRARGEKP